MALDGYYVYRLEKVLEKGIENKKTELINFLQHNLYPIYHQACAEAKVPEESKIKSFYSHSQTSPKCTEQDLGKKLLELKRVSPVINRAGQSDH